MNNPESKNFSDEATIPTSIAPWLSVRNIVKAVDFYKSALEQLKFTAWKPPMEACRW